MKMKSYLFVFLVLNFFLNVEYINCSDIEFLKQCPKVFSSPFRSETLNVTTKNEVKNLELEKNSVITNEEKGRLCLKNLSRCYDEEIETDTLVTHLSKILFSSAAPLDFTSVNGVSSICKLQTRQYLRDLKRFKLWALKMYDSSAKIPSGILNGNVNQLGDFDMCMNLQNEEQNIQGKYCLAFIQFETLSNPYVAALQRLVQSHYHFRTRLEDPGHRVPRFSSINWALCVPSGCSPQDVTLGIKRKLQNFFTDTSVQFNLTVNPDMCQMASEQQQLPMSTIITMSIFGGVIALVLGAALYDYTALGVKNRWIMAFSLRKNLNSLWLITRPTDDIEAIHGIRFFNAVMLLAAHKSMIFFFAPYTNRTEMVEFISKPWTVVGRAASLYTDPFLMISGILTTYSLLGKLQRTKKINIFEEYFSRLLRILPSLCALMAFCTFVLPWSSSGPMWNMVVTQHSKICKKTWWRNLLFIHNYFGFRNICLTHTHHIGIDTQLFFLTPFVITALWKWPKKSIIVLSTLALISTAMRFYVTYTLKLSNYIYFGTSTQQLFDTADHMYTLPVHRATVYIMGILLGYVLQEYKSISLSKTQLRIGDTIALSCFFVSLLGPSFMGKIDYIYNAVDAAWYAAIVPILWCLSFAWVIFTTHTGYRGIIGQFFSKPVFHIWTKISYGVYLTQFPTFFYNVGTTRTSEHYQFFEMMVNIKEITTVILSAIVLTLLFEMPFQNIRNLIVKKNNSNIQNDQLKKK